MKAEPDSVKANNGGPNESLLLLVSSVSNDKEARAEQEVPSVKAIQVSPVPSARHLPAAVASPKSSRAVMTKKPKQNRRFL